MTERLELLVGNKINDIKSIHVLVLGLGGVGGYATESIVRCGIKEITIVDADKVDLTNLNRQIIATRSTIGMNKTDAFEKRLKDINPELIINKITEYIDESNMNLYFDNKNIDYIIDCCDSIKTKQALIEYCINNNIKLISCMGTGNKLHPERLNIMKLKDTKYDPIAKRLRKFVKDKRINKDIYVVCSDEEGHVKHIDTIPSNSFVPATAGLLCTSFIINDIIK